MLYFAVCYPSPQHQEQPPSQPPVYRQPCKSPYSSFTCGGDCPSRAKICKKKLRPVDRPTVDDFNQDDGSLNGQEILPARWRVFVMCKTHAPPNRWQVPTNVESSVSFPLFWAAFDNSPRRMPAPHQCMLVVVVCHASSLAFFPTFLSNKQSLCLILIYSSLADVYETR